jgi:hypothetical protein
VAFQPLNDECLCARLEVHVTAIFGPRRPWTNPAVWQNAMSFWVRDVEPHVANERAIAVNQNTGSYPKGLFLRRVSKCEFESHLTVAKSILTLVDLHPQ